MTLAAADDDDDVRSLPFSSALGDRRSVSVSPVTAPIAVVTQPVVYLYVELHFTGTESALSPTTLYNVHINTSVYFPYVTTYALYPVT